MFLCLVFLVALWFRIAVPSLPLFDPDSWGYLNPALSEIADSGFQQTHGRGIAYPFFLLIILRFTGDLHAVPLLQHAIGLLSGLVWWGSWLLWSRWLPAHLGRPFWVHCCGLLFLFLFLCNANAIFYESSIRPEAIFPFLALGQTWLCLAYARLRWADERNALASLTGALAMLSALVCLSAKPSWGLAAAVPFVLVISGIFGSSFRASFFPRVAALVLGLALCLAWLKALPPGVGWIPDQNARNFLPATLFTVHAPILAEVIRQRVDNENSLPGERDFLQNFDLRIAESRQRTQTYKTLGHDADYLMYSSDTLSRLPVAAGSASGREYMFLAYRQAWFSFPSQMVRKVFRQLGMACSDLSRTIYHNRIRWGSALRASARTLGHYHLPAIGPKLTDSFALILAGHKNQMQSGSERLNLGPAFHGFLARGLGPLFLSFWLLAWPFLAVWVAVRCKSSTASFRNALTFMGVMWASVVGAIMTVALVHSFDIDRYLHLLSGPQSLFLAASLALTFALVLNLLRMFDQNSKSGHATLTQ